MMLGMSTETYTLLHVVISVAGLGSGFVVMYGWLTGKQLDRWTVTFLVTTLATSVTGFGFPVEKVLPSHILGGMSLVVLVIAVLARHRYLRDGAWRRTYVTTSAIALYFNVFVFVVQSFQKVPALKALAPKGSEPPFLVAQLVVLALFVPLTILAAKRFPAQSARAA